MPTSSRQVLRACRCPRCSGLAWPQARNRAQRTAGDLAQPPAPQVSSLSAPVAVSPMALGGSGCKVYVMTAYAALNAAAVAAVQQFVRLGGGLLLGGHFWGSEGQYTDPGECWPWRLLSKAACCGSLVAEAACWPIDTTCHWISMGCTDRPILSALALLLCRLHLAREQGVASHGPVVPLGL